MKIELLPLALLALSTTATASPGITISTTTNSRNFPLDSETPLVVPLTKDNYTLTVTGIEGHCSADPQAKIKFNTPINLNCGSPTTIPIKIRFTGDYAFHYQAHNHTLSFVRQSKKLTNQEFKRPIPDIQCEQYAGGEVVLNIGNEFSENTQLRDAFTGNIVKVKNQTVTITPSPDSGGLILLEPVDIKPQPFTYRNANIYFVMVDRFNNGDTTNDNQYGRNKDGKQEIGTFHGGDLQGVIEKLDYIKSLGTDAIWLSPITEQVHGFVGGGDSGSFPFYAYHGYWTRDFTKIDQNFGNDKDLTTLVTQAHQRGLKVLLDAVINHPGYATLADLQAHHINVVNDDNLPKKWANWAPSGGENWHSFHNDIDYNSDNWKNWWGGDWVRAGLPGYPQPGSGDKTMTLAGLPDFLTESTEFVKPPQWLLDNPGTHVINKENYTVSDYLVEWQTDWVKRFGIDGYRVDTVKHVEGKVWKQLKQSASDKLAQWREENNQQGLPFWMMGEVWGHGAYRSPYFDDGFDALINFDVQKNMDKGAACFSQMESTYFANAQALKNKPDFNPVSYMSSHDTELFFSRFKSFDMQRNAANALLLNPGAVQVYYGDEVARDLGPYADDFHQGTRSDMVWQLDKQRQKLLQHWRIVGQFRQRHPAVGAGEHRVIEQNNAYVFSRSWNSDKIIVGFVGH